MRQTPTWKDRSDHVIEALLEMNDEAACSLAAKLADCGKAWSGRFRCRQPLCGSCRASYQRRQARLLIDECCGLSREDLAMLTVVHRGTDTIADIDPLVDGLARGARNRLDALRRDDLDLWGGVAMRMWVEFDAIAGDQIPLLGSSRRALLPEIASLAIDRPEPTWLVTAHGLLARGAASFDQLTVALSEQWPIAGQVDVRLLDDTKTVSENITGIVSYANKHSCLTTFGTIKEPWPWQWQAEIFKKLSEKRNAFEYLRFGIGPASSLQSPQDTSVISDPVLEPMPFEHSSITFPAYYITGRPTD